MVLEEKIKASIVVGVDKGSLNKSLKSTEDDINGFKRRLNSSRGIQLANNLAQIRIKLQGLRADLKAATTNKQRLEIQTNIEKVKKELTQANRELNNFSRTGSTTKSKLGQYFDSIGNRAKAMGRQILTAFASLIAVQKIVSFFQTGIQQARQFESELARINTVAKLGQKELSGFGDAVRKVSRTYGVAAEELLDAGFDIFSAGVQLKDASQILELSAQVAIGAGTDTKTAFGGLISVIKGYGLAVSDATKIADLFFLTNEIGQTTVGEVSNALLGLTTVASQTGITLDEMFAVFATGTGVLGAANDVGTKLESLLFSLAAPSEALKKVYKEVGIETAKTSIENEGFISVLEKVGAAVNNDTGALKELLGRKEAVTLATALLTSSNQKYKDSVDAMTESQGALIEAVKTQISTNDAYLRIAENRRSLFRQKIGNYIVEVIVRIGQLGLATQQVFNGISTSVAILVATFAQGIANIGIGIRNVAVSVSNGVAGILNNGLEALEKFINENISGLNTLLKLISKLPGVGDLSINQSIGLGRIGTLQKGEFVNFIDDAIDAGIDRANALEQAFQDAISPEVDQVKFDIASEKISALQKDIEKITNDTGGGGRGGGKAAVDTLDKIAKKRAEVFGKIKDNQLEKLLKNTKKNFEDLGETIEDSIDKSKDNIKDLEDQIKSLTSELEKIDNEISSQSNKLLDRYVKIQNQLAEGDNDFATINALKEELRLIEQNTDAESRREAVRVDRLSETEKILENIEALEAQKEARKNELDALKIQKEQEQVILEEYQAFREQIEIATTNIVQAETRKRKAIIESEIKKVKELIALQQQAGLLSPNAQAPSQSTTNKSNQVSQTFNTTINSATDERRFIRDVADASKNSSLGYN